MRYTPALKDGALRKVSVGEIVATTAGQAGDKDQRRRNSERSDHQPKWRQR